MRNLINILDLSVEELDELMRVAKDIMANPSAYSEKCKGKKLATLFFEPSTRTRLSFEAAMYELGGNVIGFSEASSSSVSKGESVADTIQVVNCYADIIAMRHPLAGAALVACQVSKIPVINAGDGGHFHPTQTLADLLTIDVYHQHLDNLTIGICGDLKYGRTVHSLIAAMSRYPGTKFVLISPDELAIPQYVKDDFLDKNNIPYKEVRSLEEAMADLDILYMTRIQRERFDDVDEYERLKDSYVLDSEKMKAAKEDMCILHPLPRVNEISVEVDNDPRAHYFDEARCGKYMRMALILKLLNEKEESKVIDDDILINELYCDNPKCITSCEQGVKHLFKKAVGKPDTYYCAYCEKEKVL